MKTCTKCGSAKPLNLFHKHIRHVDGRQAQCKSCTLTKNKEWAQANPKRKQACNAAWDARNQQQVNKTKRAWAKANPEKVAKKWKKWASINTSLLTALHAKRRAAKLQQTPWKDPRVDALYKIAAWLRSKGDNVHIDHIIPLQPANSNAPVGLHVYANLQILPAIENFKKGNRT